MLVQNIHSFSHFMTNYCYKMFLFVTCTDLFFFLKKEERRVNLCLSGCLDLILLQNRLLPHSKLNSKLSWKRDFFFIYNMFFSSFFSFFCYTIPVLVFEDSCCSSLNSNLLQKKPKHAECLVAMDLSVSQKLLTLKAGIELGCRREHKQQKPQMSSHSCSLKSTRNPSEGCMCRQFIHKKLAATYTFSLSFKLT